MKIFKLKLLDIYKTIPKRFLIVGIINTIFGYFIGVFSLFFFLEKFHVLLIGIINNFITISFAFILLKKFVFFTKNKSWLIEYIRSFIVYGLKAVIGIFILWISIDLLNLNIFLSQGLSMLITFFFTYKAHKKFTFKL